MDLAAAGQGIGRRFQVVTVLPTFVLVIGVWFVVASGGFSAKPDLSKAAETFGDLDVAEVAFVGLAIVALALITHPFQLGLVKAFEGYLSDKNPLVRYSLARHSRVLHHHHSQKLVLREREAILAARLAEGDRETNMAQLSRVRRWIEMHDREIAGYPREDRLMPTLLGNRLRAAEDAAGDRYGIAAVSFIPYLFAVMPVSSASRISDARNEMDTSIRLSVVLVALSAFSLLAFADDAWWLTIPLALYALGWISYRGAANAALSYGKLLGRAVDLYRFDALDALAWPRPADPVDEAKTFQLLQQHLAGRLTSGDLRLFGYQQAMKEGSAHQ
jgi:hypothetical protein